MHATRYRLFAARTAASGQGMTGINTGQMRSSLTGADHAEEPVEEYLEVR
jgi:hypothetical protein